jgi:type IV pilus assembly protein PilC
MVAKKFEKKPSGAESVKDTLEGKIKAHAVETEATARIRRARPGERPGEGPRRLTEPIRLLPPNITDMATFCRQLSTLLDVGIPLLRSLKILSERTQHPRLKSVVRKVAQRVEEGQTLSSALAEHPRIFSHLFVSVAKVGEVGGILESSMKRLADILEKKAEIKKKVLSALLYPVVSLLVCITVIVLILTIAIPKFAEVYAAEDTELPGPTKVIVLISQFVRHYPAIYIPVIVVAIFLVLAFARTSPGRYLLDWLKIRLPIVGAISTKINVARFSRTLGSLLTAGIPLLEGLSVTARTSENVLVAQGLNKVYQNVEHGGKMEEPMRAGAIFPPIVVDMVSIGDEAGALDTMLIKVADTYDNDVDISLKGLTSIIEPVLIIIMGCVVAFVAVSILLPYFNLVKVVR